MLVSLNWLREFVPYKGNAQELGDKLTMLGLEMESIFNPFAEIAEIIIGRVLKCDDHPDSDHLHVCTVDLGQTEPVIIVCGAGNVAEGQLVPVAPVGSTMPGGLKIKKAKLRGVESFGMICSERELGLSDDHNGIMILPEGNHIGETLKTGVSFLEMFHFDTEVLELGITPNRADCLSILGVAREVSAAFNLPLTLPKFNLDEFVDTSKPDASGDISIEIEDADLCPVYMGSIIENVVVEPAPLWLRQRLIAVGVRSISNLVDVTNYILMELGQPLHAFDADKLKGQAIIVKKAQEGETFVTLDAQERLLKQSDLLICDKARAIALAGVMGGQDTEISDTTKKVFLECALFQPATIRRTARRLALSSESSYRFERGVDQGGMEFALNRASYLMASLTGMPDKKGEKGAKIRTGICKKEPKPFAASEILFDPARSGKVLGVPVENSFSKQVLISLGCEVLEKNTMWTIKSPSWRYDLTRPADIVEEVARFYGVDRIEATLPRISHSLERFGLPQNSHHFAMRMKKVLVGLGLNEAINYSFVSNKDLDLLGLDNEDRVNILNPLTAEQDVLRTELAPGLLQTVQHNIAHGATGLRIFEVASSFHKDMQEETGVLEKRHLGIILYGTRFDSSYPHKEEDMGYTDLRGIVDHIFTNMLLLPAPSLEKMQKHSFLMPAVQISFVDPRTNASSIFGYMGRIKPQLADTYYARKDLWLLDLNMDMLEKASQGKISAFKPLPVFPPVRRDITFICPFSMPVETVQKAIMDQVNKSCKLLRNVELRDMYLPENKEERNLTFRLTFQHDEQTLQDDQVDKEREKIVSALAQSLSIKV